MSNKKTKVVLFKEGHIPRVFVNPPDIKALEKQGEVLINPVLPKGISPSRWYIDHKKRIQVLNKEVKGLKPLPSSKNKKTALEVKYIQKIDKRTKIHSTLNTFILISTVLYMLYKENMLECILPYINILIEMSQN